MMRHEKFKTIRKQRKLSLKTLGAVAGSATSISDFENGKTNLSNDVLLQLLSFMIVEINEFFDWEDFHDPTFTAISLQIAKASQAKNSVQLIQLQEKLKQLATTKDSYIYHILSLALEVLEANYQGKKAKPETITELTDYFFSLEYWTNLDIGLLGNMVHDFTTETLALFTDAILTETPQQLRNNLDRIKIDTILNCLSVLLERGEKQASQALLNQLTHKDYPNYFLFERLCLTELQAIYDFNWGDKQRALANHTIIIETITLLFSKEEAKEWDDDFQKKTDCLR